MQVAPLLVTLSNNRFGNTDMASENDLLTIEEAAEYRNVSVTTLRRWRQDGVGPVSWREGQRLVYPRSGLDLHRARQRERTIRGDGVTK